jgi:hypothetical protein
MLLILFCSSVGLLSVTALAHKFEPSFLSAAEAYFMVSAPSIFAIILWFRLRKLAQEFQSRYPRGEWRELDPKSENFAAWSAAAYLGQALLTVLLTFTTFMMISSSYLVRRW